MLEIDYSTKKNILVDTTGSVIYLPETVLKELKETRICLTRQPLPPMLLKREMIMEEAR